jgi:hypothetical protein
VLIDRNDKRSQLRSFKQAINYLTAGVPIMAFPEGARSPDGRLMAFKPGKYQWSNLIMLFRSYLYLTYFCRSLFNGSEGEGSYCAIEHI